MSLLSRVNLPPWLSSFLKNPLINNPLYKNPISRNIFLAIGATYVLSKVIGLTKGLLSLTRSPKDLVARYGKNTWALITGSSDGIGKEFAFELAKRGFNIVLVGRNKEKLEIVEKALKSVHPIETRVIVEDFTKAHEPEFAERIYDQVNDLDISILVNNAGVGITKRYEVIPIEKIREIVTVNCLSHALITRILLPKLAARTQKSAIINISSFASYAPLPGMQLYAASKAFHDFLSRGMSYEYPEIDILSLRPAGISTSMINYKKPNAEIILPEEFVRAGLDALGHTDQTPGHFKHRRLLWFFETMPAFWRERTIKKLYLRKRKSEDEGQMGAAN